MTSLAVLGLEVESKSVEKGAKSLDKLSASAKKAQGAANALAPAERNVAAASQSVAKSSDVAATAQQRMAQAARANRMAQAAMTKSSNMLAFRQRQLAVQSLDVAQTLALGIPPMMVAVQQGGQIAGIYAGQGGVAGAFKEAARMVLGFVKTHPLLTAATAAIGIGFAGITAEINKSSDTAVSFGNVVRASINVAASSIKSLLAPAINAISPAFSAAWSAAVGFTKSAINTIIGAAVGAYKFIVAEWSNLPAAFGDLAYRAGDAFLKGIENMIHQTLTGMNSMMAELGVSMRFDNRLFGLGIENPYAGAANAGGGAAAFSEAFNRDYVGEAYNSVRRESIKLAKEAAEADESASKASKKAADDSLKSMNDAIKKAQELKQAYMETAKEAANSLGSSVGGVLRGLIDQTTSWKDAALQAINSVISYLNKMNVAKGGSGLFGGGFFQSLLGGLLGIGFSKGGYTGGSSTQEARGVVHGKEYVVNAAATARYRPQLEAMNSGRAPANVNAPSASNQNVNVTVSVDDSGAIQAYVARETQAGIRNAAPVLVQASVRETNKRIPQMMANAQERTL